MPFTVPQFPLDCDIYTGPWIGKVFRATVSANLVFGRRSYLFPSTLEVAENSIYVAEMFVLFPAGTDVRTGAQGIPAHDYLELPADSGRWYMVQFVDDVGKGFDNEHRQAAVSQVCEILQPSLWPGANWPIPMP